MTEAIFYTDSTPPLATIGDLTMGINGCTKQPVGETAATCSTDPPTSINPVNRVEYALYEDSATWSAWTAWAEDNVYNVEQLNKYSARAL